MELRKDDPVYYKKKITDLLNQAKENNLEIAINQGIISFKSTVEFDGMKNNEIANADLNKFTYDEYECGTCGVISKVNLENLEDKEWFECPKCKSWFKLN